MAQVRSWAGLDVHARSVLAVTVDGVSGEMRWRRLAGVTSAVVEFCAALPMDLVGGLEHTFERLDLALYSPLSLTLEAGSAIVLRGTSVPRVWQ
jgi:hypothetical protein